MMKQLISTICFLFFFSNSFSQSEQGLLKKALENYKKELPKLEKQAFKELRKFSTNGERPKRSEFKKYHFIIIPIYTLKKEYAQYCINDTDTFAKYIDFEKMQNDFDIFVFKDFIYKGSLHLSSYDNSYFSANDTLKYQKTGYNIYFNLIKEIQMFKSDIAFFPSSRLFICFIKNERLYIRAWTGQLQLLNYILPAKEFIKKNPSFIKELQSDPNTEIDHRFIKKH